MPGHLCFSAGFRSVTLDLGFFDIDSFGPSSQVAWLRRAVSGLQAPAIGGGYFFALMDRYAVFVDAGSLLSFVANECTGEQHRRRIRIDPDQFIRALIDWSNEVVGLPLLRLYWYDGAMDVPTREHRAIAAMDDVKLRLGRVVQGKQKGVDALLYSDLIELIEHRAVVTVLIIASDGDFVEAVERCQRRGLRVELAAVAPQSVEISGELRNAVDALRTIPMDLLRPFVSVVPVAAVAASASPPAGSGTVNKSAAGSSGSPKEAIMSRDPDVAREAQLTIDVDALVTQLATAARDLLDPAAAIALMQDFPAIPHDRFGEMMTKSSALVGARLSDGLKQRLKTNWRAAFKARNEELKRQTL